MSCNSRVRPSPSEPASRTPSAIHSSRSTPITARAPQDSGSIVDLTLDDDYDTGGDSEASFHTARGTSERPLDLRSSSPESIDPHPRKTKREAQLVERDRLGKRPARAQTISDSEAEEEEFQQGHLERERNQAIRRKYDQGPSTSRRISREDDHDHDIIVESSPFLDFSMPALVGAGNNNPRARAMSLDSGAQSSDVDVDLDMDSEGGEAFRRALAAEVRALDLTAAPSTPNVLSSRDSAPHLPNAGETSSFRTNAEAHPNDNQLVVEVSTGPDHPFPIVTASRDFTRSGTDRSVHGLPVSGNQAVDEKQEDRSIAQFSTVSKRIPQTPPYPPPLSEPDLDIETEQYVISGLDGTEGSVPFPQTPPGPPPDSLPRISGKGATPNRATRPVCLGDSPSPSLATQPTFGPSQYTQGNQQDMSRPYLIKPPESYKPILRKWDPTRDGLAGPTPASPEWPSMLLSISADNRLEAIAALSGDSHSTPGVSYNQTRTLDSSLLSIDPPSTTSCHTVATRASTSSAIAGARFEEERSRLQARSSGAMVESRQTALRADEIATTSEPPSLLSRFSGLSTGSLESRRHYSADKTRGTSPNAAPGPKASYQPSLLSRISKVPAEDDESDLRLSRNGVASSISTAKTTFSAESPGCASWSRPTHAGTTPLSANTSSSVDKASKPPIIGSPSTGSSQSHHQIANTTPTTSEVTSALVKAISNSKTSVQVVQFLLMELEHLRGDCMEDYEVIFSPDYDCPTRAFLEMLMMRLGGVIIPHDSPRAAERSVRSEITRIFVCGVPDPRKSPAVVAAEAYDSAMLMDLITRLRDGEAGRRSRRPSQRITKSQTTTINMCTPKSTMASSSKSSTPSEASLIPVTRQGISIAKGLNHRIGNSAVQGAIPAGSKEPLPSTKANTSSVMSSRKGRGNYANTTSTTPPDTFEGTFYGKNLITRMRRTDDIVESGHLGNTRSSVRLTHTPTMPLRTRSSDGQTVPVDPPRARTLRERMRA